jgi:hypothetical protein
MTRRRAVPLAVLALLAAMALAARSIASQTHTSARLTVQPTPGTFISLVPACACARHTELDEFSLHSGRLLRRLGPVTPGGYILGTLATTTRGEIMFLSTSGARCDAKGVFMECPKIVANSCRNFVKTIVPGRSTLTTRFTLPGSEAVSNAAPSPDGSRVALTLGPCTGTHGTTGTFVRDLATGQMHAVLTTQNPCDGYGRPAWNRSGTELAFEFARANGPPGSIVGGGLVCLAARDRLAIVPVAGTAAHIKLLSPDHGCDFPAAAWDRVGLAVAEGCSKGGPHGFYSPNLGQAYLKQFNAEDHCDRHAPTPTWARAGRTRDRSVLRRCADHPGPTRKRALPGARLAGQRG